MPLNPRSAVALGEVSSQVIHPEADLVLLVGLGFSKDLNHFIREEVMDTNRYMELFFPFRKLDFRKKGKDAAWFIDGDNTMLALAMTFRKEPDAQIMCFLRDYAERYDWLVQVFQDWSLDRKSTRLNSSHAL